VADFLSVGGDEEAIAWVDHREGPDVAGQEPG
jgi:hypothetical protein